jgi:hypothetical protein
MELLNQELMLKASQLVKALEETMFRMLTSKKLKNNNCSYKSKSTAIAVLFLF